MKRFVRIILQVLTGVLIALIGRKIIIGYYAIKFVTQCKHQISYQSLLDSDQMRQLHDDDQRRPLLVLFLNRFALDMTYNWLCNTQLMRDVHLRTLMVTMDVESDRRLANDWTNIRRFHWPVSCLKDAFNYGDGAYQLFYVFRSNFAGALLESNVTFWMIQQDTVWLKSIFELNLTSLLDASDTDIVFDRADDTLDTLIAGGYYYSKPSVKAKAYFRQLSADLLTLFVPDNALMTSLCSDTDRINCRYIPFSMITNWKWLHEGGQTIPPDLLQFDGYTELGGKLAVMRSLGFDFLNSDNSSSCNSSTLSTLNIQNSSSVIASKSWSHHQFGFYQSLIRWCYRFQSTKYLLNRYIFRYGHYLMITM